jgi:polyisoprenoid-binding protein YceI
MKSLAILVISLVVGNFQAAYAQKFFTKEAKISFDAEGVMDDLEEIKANTNTAVCVFDQSTGKMEWSVLMKSFAFKNALMQEHFNENYVESSKFPKAKFTGQIENADAVNFSKPGSYPVIVSGQMTIHGISKNISEKGTVKVESNGLRLDSEMMVLLSDYGIKIPSLVGDKLSNEVHVSIQAELKPFKK